MATKITRKPYALWKIGDEEYKLKLRSAEICEAEDEVGKSLVSYMGDDAGMPPLKDMLKITHYAMKSMNHGIKASDVYDLFDQYVECGGSQVAFYTDVFIPIYEVSGFFSQAQSKALAEAMKSSKA